MSLNYRDFLAEVWRAATTPSLAALVGTLSVSIVIFLSCLVFLTPDLVAKYGYYLMEDPNDNYAYLTAKVLQMQRTPSINNDVVIVGNSAAKEAIVANYLEQSLQQKMQIPFTVHKLSVGGLFLWEQICVLNNIRDQIHGVVIIQVQPTYLALDRDHLKGGITRHSRLAMYCPLFDEEMRLAGVEAPRWTNNYFLDHYKFFIARLHAFMINLVRGPVTWRSHDAETWRPPTPSQWDRAVKNITRWQKDYHKYRASNLEVYRRLIQYLQQKDDVRVVLLDATINPRAEAIIFKDLKIKELYVEYQQDMKNFAQEMHIPFLDLGNAEDFQAEDFIDHVHLSKPSARRRYTEALAVQLVNVISSIK